MNRHPLERRIAELDRQIRWARILFYGSCALAVLGATVRMVVSV